MSAPAPLTAQERKKIYNANYYIRNRENLNKKSADSRERMGKEALAEYNKQYRAMNYVGRRRLTPEEKAQRLAA